MKLLKFTGFIPWVFIGSLIGSVFIVPMISKLVDKFYYKSKYNNESIYRFQQYIDSSYTIKVAMPSGNSKYFLYNVDKERYPLFERFDTTYSSQNYFNNPCAEYTFFYCHEYKKYMNIITFKDVNGNYGNKELYLTVNRDDMNNPEYGTKDNPVPVLKAVGVSEPIWFSGKDTDSVFIDNFYRNNVINYLKYKMPKEEFKRRFKSKE